MCSPLQIVAFLPTFPGSTRPASSEPCVGRVRSARAVPRRGAWGIASHGGRKTLHCRVPAPVRPAFRRTRAREREVSVRPSDTAGDTLACRRARAATPWLSGRDNARYTWRADPAGPCTPPGRTWPDREGRPLAGRSTSRVGWGPASGGPELGFAGTSPGQPTVRLPGGWPPLGQGRELQSERFV